MTLRSFHRVTMPIAMVVLAWRRWQMVPNQTHDDCPLVERGSTSSLYWPSAISFLVSIFYFSVRSCIPTFTQCCA